MKMREIVKRLKGNYILITSAELSAMLPISYNYLRDLLVGFIEDETNKTTEKDLADYDAGIYPVLLSFQDKIRYYAGYDIYNQPAWAEDEYEDIDVNVLGEIVYFIICTKIENILKEEENIEDFRVDIDEVPLIDERTRETLVNSAISVWVMWKEDSEDSIQQSMFYLYPGYKNSLVYYMKSGMSEKAAREIEDIIS